MNTPYAQVDVVFNGLEITVGLDFGDDLNPCIDTMDSTATGSNLFGLLSDVGESQLLDAAIKQHKAQCSANSDDIAIMNFDNRMAA